MRLFRLICLVSVPLIGLAPLPVTAGPAPGLQGSSPANGPVAQVQYLEVVPDVPPAAVEDDDDDDGFQADAVSRCAAQFRSFEPETGYYTTYGGERVLCPYLQ